MIVTRKLVFINFPKTGSSFVRKVLAETFTPRASRRSAINRISRSIGKRFPSSGALGGLGAACAYLELATAPYRVLDCFNPVRGYYDQHGKVHQAPKQLLQRRFVSVARNPLSRFCSYYHYFKTVKEDRYLPLLRDAITSSRTPISEISPEAFYDRLFWKHNCIWMQSAGLQEVIGPQTLDFVNHFSMDPIAAFQRLGDGADFDELRDLFPRKLVLLHYDDLASQLRAELEQAGISTFPAGHPIWSERVLPDGVGGNFTRESAKHVLPTSLVERIEREEWFLFDAYAKLRVSELEPVPLSNVA